jgi:hypothetical protein
MVHVAATHKYSWCGRALLQINENKVSATWNWQQFMVAHLMELILFEILRGESSGSNQLKGGLLAGLADPITCSFATLFHNIFKSKPCI